MPRYDFICTNKKCDTDAFEVLFSFAEVETYLANKNASQPCPNCKKKTRDRKDFYKFSFIMPH